MIIETFRESGVPINELYACGYSVKGQLDDADLCGCYKHDNKDKRIGPGSCTGSGNVCFCGCRKGKGGYDSIVDAAKVMGKVKENTMSLFPEMLKYITSFITNTRYSTIISDAVPMMS